MRVRHGWLLLALLVAGPELSAQGTDTNVVTASADAFGVSIGIETLGVYGPSQGRMPVRLDDGAYNPTQTLVNVGARYRFSLAGRPATLRVQVQNVTDQKVWYVYDLSGGLASYPPLHLALAYLSADF